MKFKNIQELLGENSVLFKLLHTKTAFKFLTALTTFIFQFYFLIIITGFKNFKNIQEHSVQIQDIQGYLNEIIKFKNIQDFRLPV